MGKSLDIIKKTKSTKPTAPSKQTPKTNPSKSGLWGLIMVIGGLAILVYGFLTVTMDNTYAPSSTKYGSTPTPESSPDITIEPSIISTSPAISTPSPASASTTTPTPTTITIQIYDAGAGQEASKSLANTLTNNGYQAEYVGVSQLTRDDSSMSYREDLASDANKIATLYGKAIQSTASQIKGVFDIIIWLGKN